MWEQRRSYRIRGGSLSTLTLRRIISWICSTQSVMIWSSYPPLTSPNWISSVSIIPTLTQITSSLRSISRLAPPPLPRVLKYWRRNLIPSWMTRNRSSLITIFPSCWLRGPWIRYMRSTSERMPLRISWRRSNSTSPPWSRSASSNWRP